MNLKGSHMQNKYHITAALVLDIVLVLTPLIRADVEQTYARHITLTSADAELILHKDQASQKYFISFEYHDRTFRTYDEQSPLTLELNGIRKKDAYLDYRLSASTLLCKGTITSENGTQFQFIDRYLPAENSSFELQRTVQIINPHEKDLYFNTVFGIELSARSTITTNDFFVPAIWYKTNFQTKMSGVLATDPNDNYFIFREDRLPMPLAMLRSKSDGLTVSLIHKESSPTTFYGENGIPRIIDDRIQFGSIGIRQFENSSLVFMFPGSEGEKSSLSGRRKEKRWALRSHPVKEGTCHEYKLVIDFAKTSSYPDAIQRTWRTAYALYQPEILAVDLQAAFDGLMDTLKFYYMPADKKGSGFDAAGFPFSVYLPEGTVRVYNYQMGFIGRQIPNAYYFIREGLLGNDAELVKKGFDVIDFWSEESLTPDGLPRTWYDPAAGENRTGSWRTNDNILGGTSMRVASGGMEAMLSAWRIVRRHGIDKPQWLDACKKFGDWLVENQNTDGSYYLAYEHRLTDGKHRPTHTSKYTTTNPIRFLVELYMATNDQRYKQAALKAGEFSFEVIHKNYSYIGSVIDNPNVIDRESGQKALYSFLSLYDLTTDNKWLDAAIQAAHYTVTWMYSYEVPAEIGRSDTHFPADRSITGQTLIATGHSKADLGFAFSAYHYYRLYLMTADQYFLHITKMLMHNTKQSMNWDGTIYDGKQKGLQLEAFSVTVPRRRGVMQCLSWNYAAHLDPLIRFRESFGTFDLDELENLSFQQRLEMVEISISRKEISHSD
ncbi:hypothetical protein ACFL1G_02285 [Planctomycetota bacterium]